MRIAIGLPACLILSVVACNNADKPKSTSLTTLNESSSNGQRETAPSAHTQPPTVHNNMQQAKSDAVPDPLTGTVKETMDAGGYTYVYLASDHGDIWAAAMKFPVKVGDKVELRGLMPMANFKSPSLNRTFEIIQFVSSAKVVSDGGGSATVAPAPFHGSAAGDAGATAANDHTHVAAASDVNVERLADGVTVGELYERKSELNGQSVKFRGKVVKANAGILGRNWMHVQDGTGESGMNDITVTSAQGFAEVGKVIVVEGTLALDRDFGAGYAYEAIVENATITPE